MLSPTSGNAPGSRPTAAKPWIEHNDCPRRARILCADRITVAAPIERPIRIGFVEFHRTDELDQIKDEGLAGICIRERIREAVGSRIRPRGFGLIGPPSRKHSAIVSAAVPSWVQRRII